MANIIAAIYEGLLCIKHSMCFLQTFFNGMPTSTLGSMDYEYSFIDIRDFPPNNITFFDKDET